MTSNDQDEAHRAIDDDPSSTGVLILGGNATVSGIEGMVPAPEDGEQTAAARGAHRMQESGQMADAHSGQQGPNLQGRTRPIRRPTVPSPSMFSSDAPELDLGTASTLMSVPGQGEWNPPTLPAISHLPDRYGILNRRMVAHTILKTMETLEAAGFEIVRTHVPVTERLANQVHFNYVVKSVPTLKCGTCGATRRDEVYQCQHEGCAQQICKECVMHQMAISESIVWGGTHHIPFLAAWKHRQLVEHGKGDVRMMVYDNIPGGSSNAIGVVTLTEMFHVTARRQPQPMPQAQTVSQPDRTAPGMFMPGVQAQNLAPSRGGQYHFNTANLPLRGHTGNAGGVMGYGHPVPWGNTSRHVPMGVNFGDPANTSYQHPVFQRLEFPQGISQPVVRHFQPIVDPAQIPTQADKDFVKKLHGAAASHFLHTRFFANNMDINGNELTEEQAASIVFNHQQRLEGNHEIPFDVGDGFDQWGNCLNRPSQRSTAGRQNEPDRMAPLIQAAAAAERLASLGTVNEENRLGSTNDTIPAQGRIDEGAHGRATTAFRGRTHASANPRANVVDPAQGGNSTSLVAGPRFTSQPSGLAPGQPAPSSRGMRVRMAGTIPVEYVMPDGLSLSMMSPYMLIVIDHRTGLPHYLPVVRFPAEYMQTTPADTPEDQSRGMPAAAQLATPAGTATFHGIEDLTFHNQGGSTQLRPFVQDGSTALETTDHAHGAGNFALASHESVLPMASDSRRIPNVSSQAQAQVETAFDKAPTALSCTKDEPGSALIAPTTTSATGVATSGNQPRRPRGQWDLKPPPYVPRHFRKIIPNPPPIMVGPTSGSTSTFTPRRAVPAPGPPSHRSDAEEGHEHKAAHSKQVDVDSADRPSKMLVLTEPEHGEDQDHN